jgi:signal transduction histidine kinase
MILSIFTDWRPMSDQDKTTRFRQIYIKFKQTKLLPKLFIHSVSLILLVLIIVSGTIYYFQKQMILRQAEEKAMSLAETLAYSSLNAILLDEYGTLQELIDGIIHNPDVSSIAILDTTGMVIAADRPELRGHLYQDSLTVKALASPTAIFQKLPEAKNMEIWETAVPISNLDQRIATARIKYSVEDTYAGLLNTIVFIGLFAILLSLILSYYFARSISNPIKQVVELASAYGKGDLEATIPIEREDEIGHLIHALNKLSQDLKHMIEEKISNESLIMIGEFAAYIIHDLKNPLSGIHLLADGMHRRIEDKNPIKKYSTEILLATQKLEDFIGKTLDIARWTKIDKKPLLINELIEQEIKAIQYKSIPVRTHYDPLMPEIQGDAQLLSMAVRNLLTNAIEAIPDQGTISIETRRVDQDTIINIVDTGTGIDADRLGKIFRPFYSMKTQGHGLGLAMVKKAVILHQGEIKVKSEKGVGSQFTIILPDLA